MLILIYAWTSLYKPTFFPYKLVFNYEIWKEAEMNMEKCLNEMLVPPFDQEWWQVYTVFLPFDKNIKKTFLV